MAIHIKTAEEQDKMRAAGKLAAQTLEYIAPLMVVGTSTHIIDEYVRIFTEENNAICAPFNYHDYPAHCCISINNVACHGIAGSYKLQDGDIVNVDVTPKLDGWHGDTSKMFLIGNVSDEDRELCTIAHDAMWAGIHAIEPGRDIKAIGRAISLYMLDQPAVIAKDFCGHGTGLNFHEEPQILHFAYFRDLGKMVPGMTFTIEPIINKGSGRTITSTEDNWTVTTMDGLKSAQWEHTILVTRDGYEILTLRDEEQVLPAKR